MGDFTQVETKRLSLSAQDTLESLIALLGWRLADSEAKRLPFASAFTSLGVRVVFTDTATGTILLENKPGRVQSIREQVDLFTSVANPRRIGFKDALSLRGKISFAEGHTFARLTAPLARMLSIWAGVPIPRFASEELAAGLEFGIEHLEVAGPRIVGPRRDELPHVVFADGACESSGTSVGALMISPNGFAECFGAELDQATVDSWKSKLEQTQVIGQAELFPLLLARKTWAKTLKGRRVIYFIDNESARIAMVRAYSPVIPSLKIIMQCIAWDLHNDCSPWYARVPTACNPADGPSRMSLDTVPAWLNAKVVPPIFPDGCKPARVLSMEF